MRIIESPELASTVLGKAKEGRAPRAPGWHATDHTKCLRKTVFKLLSGREDVEVDEDLELMYIRGEGLHMFLSQDEPEFRFYAPGFGFCSLDMTWPDGAKMFPDGLAPMELKSTRMSAAYPLTEDMSATQSYITQVAMYLVKKLRKQGVPIQPKREYQCYLYVLYEMGDYTTRKPTHRAFILHLTGEELIAWDKELQHRHGLLLQSISKIADAAEDDDYLARQVERLGDLLPADVDLEPLLPPVSEHWPWECEKYSLCPLKELLNCPGTAQNARWGIPFAITEESYAREHKTRKSRTKKS